MVRSSENAASGRQEATDHLHDHAVTHRADFPNGIRLAVNRSLLNELDSYTDWERRVTGFVKKTEDSAEGRLSFKQKRKPQFNGR